MEHTEDQQLTRVKVVTRSGKRRFRNLTPKQKRFLDNLKAGMDMQQAALSAGYTPATAHNTKQNIVDSPVMQSAIVGALDKLNINTNTLAKKYQQLLEAARIELVSFAAETTDDEIRQAIEAIAGAKLIRISDNVRRGRVTGRLVHFAMPNTETQKAVLEMAHKLRGDFAPEKHQVESVSFGVLITQLEADGATGHS